MEWIVAVGVFLVVCGLVVGVPVYLAATSWSTRADRRAAATRRARAAATGETWLDPRIVPPTLTRHRART